MSHRPLLLAGNWKMHGTATFTRELILHLLEAAPRFSSEVAVFPPYCYLAEAKRLLSSSQIALGAQDLSFHENGPYTGEISASMLADLACRYVIVGHSERRSYHQESSECVAKKATAAIAFGLQPIVCLGETWEAREAEKAYSVIDEQLKPLLSTPDLLSHLSFAYEPVWAIGTGKTATPEQAQEVHAYIRGKIAEKTPSIASKIRILYGGSVKPDNAEALLSMPDIDGGLIGGASLKATEFSALCQIKKT